MPDFSTSSARPGGVPDISLGVNPGSVAAPGLFGPGMSGIDAISKLASTQNALNQNKLFQQQFIAKQAAGQILAQSPDLETGIKGLYSDPRTAAFAGEIASSARQAALFQQQIQNERQSGAQSARESGLKLFAGAKDPSQVPALVKAGKATMSPTSLPTAGSALDALAESLTAGLEKYPPELRQQIYNQRLIGITTGAGIPIESMLKQYPSAELTNMQSGLKPMLVNPGFLGGGVTSAGPEIPFGVPMNIQPTPGGGSVPRAGFTGEGNPLMPQTEAPTGASAGPKTAPLDSDGKPLYEGSLEGMAPQIKGATNLTPGLPLRSPAQEDNNKVLLSKYNSEGLDQFKSAQQGLGLLNLQDKAFDKLNSGGGWQTSGFAGEARNSFSQLANTVAQLAGATKRDGSANLPFDPNKVASWEDIVKNTNTLAGMLTKQQYGGGHNAAETINKVVASVPSINNSPLGAKLVSDGLKSVMNRVIDERKFTNDYKDQNAGSIDGAAEKFNELRPPDYYTKQVLAKYGMDENGFKKGVDGTSRASIRKAYEQGLITEAQAREIAKQLEAK